tara:strand:- start:4 stop:333 length:330 start_codon:yes stop_codon:yes gene_type:complete
MFKKLDLSNFIYGVGGAIVIMGALFKIEHLPGGSLLLTIGLVMEAFIFLYSAFEKNEKSKQSEPVVFKSIDTSLVIEAQQKYVNKINQATCNIESMNNFYESILKAIKK